MSPEPTQPLAYEKRTWFFRVLLLTFLIVVPIFTFYAVGYRWDIANPNNNFVTVGGLYITVAADGTEIYVNEELVRDFRLFRQAAYIQNLRADIYRVHTQGEGLQTWVKELPVFSHIVTRADSFNLPTRPHIRIVPEWRTSSDVAVLFEAATSTKFLFASTTNDNLIVATSTATTSLISNPEYVYLEQLFASSTEDKAELRKEKEVNPPQTFSFRSDVAVPTVVPLSTTSTTTMPKPTSTVMVNDMQLYEESGDVYARYTGRDEWRPPYMCIRHYSLASTSEQFGAHVAASLQEQLPTSTWNRVYTEPVDLCRTQILIDRLWQTVHDFAFMPGSTDLVLMHLDDGIYVVEIDDRAWQNTQLLYPGRHLEMLVVGGQIFVKDGSYILEILTTLPSQ